MGDQGIARRCKSSNMLSIFLFSLVTNDMYSQSSYLVGTQGRSDMRNGNSLPAFAMGAYSQMQTPSGSVGSSLEAPRHQQSNATAVLYYSNYCTICNRLIRMIESRNLKSVFALVCVDNDRKKVPEFVKSVPLAYISGRVTGCNPQLLVEGSLMEYIERCASQRQAASHSSPAPASQSHQQVSNPPNNQNPDEIGTMNSSGGSYSFLEEYASQGKPGDGIPGSFLYELRGNDVDFGVRPIDDRVSFSDENNKRIPPAFLGTVETRLSSSGDVDVSSIETLRRAEEEKWNNRN